MYKKYFNVKAKLKLGIVDACLSFIYRFRKRKQAPPSNNSKLKHILILESHLIGDVIMGLPAYRAIRDKFPDADLIFWGNKWGEELLQDQKLFDKFFITRIPWSTYDYSFSSLKRLFSQIRQLRKLKIDLALDFRGDIRNIFVLYLVGARRRVGYNFTGGSYWLTDVVTLPEKSHIIDRNLKVAKHIGAADNQPIPRLNVPKDKLQRAQQYFDKIGLKRIAFLHPGASQPKRLWLPQRFAEVVDYLHGKGYSPVLLSGPSDKTVVEAIRNECKSSPHALSIALKDIPAFLNCGMFFIGLDSGIAHIAAAIGKNVIMLFGSQLPTISSARGDSMIQIIIRGDFECRPCPKAICDRNNACMRAIQVEDVIEAIDEIENV